MDRPSSISNSNQPALLSGFPWAFILALIIVACVESAFRFAEPRALIPYNIGEVEYEATAQLLEAYGPAEISFIGSSRTRECIDAPIVSERLESALSRPVSVANYACPGTHASENLMVTKYLLANGRPSLVLYGVSCYQLWGDTLRTKGTTEFLTVPTWWRMLHEDTPQAISMLPTVIWRLVGTHWHTLRYRKRVSTLIGDFVRTFRHRKKFPLDIHDILRGAPSPSPQRGESTRWHRYFPNKSLQNRSFSEDSVTTFVSRKLKDGKYFFTKMQEESMREILRALHAADVDVVLFEIPLPALLEKHLPPDTVSNARESIARIAASENIRFIPLEDYGETWTDADFLEWSHMNLHGATRLTEWLTDHVVLPHLRLINKGN